MKCRTCNKKIKLVAANKYMVQKAKGPFEALITPTVYEAFDCPKCGCQNIVNVRETNVVEEETCGQ